MLCLITTVYPDFTQARGAYGVCLFCGWPKRGHGNEPERRPSKDTLKREWPILPKLLD